MSLQYCPPPQKIDSINFQFHKSENNFFHPEYLTLPDNTHLGAWSREHEEYFMDFEDDIRQEFTQKDPLSQQSQRWMYKILNDPMPVSLHVRRGDYFRSFFLSKEYYEYCVGILKENFPQMSIYIFSDDLEWCKRSFNFIVPTYFVDANDERHGWEDMILISRCRHHIMSNGTFSWWSVWLDNREGSLVFHPKKRNDVVFGDSFFFGSSQRNLRQIEAPLR